MKKTFFIGIFSFLLITQAYGFSEKEFKGCLEDHVKSYLKQYNGAGLAIAVIKDSFDMEKPYRKTFCFGYSKRSPKESIKESTLFRLGPLSKTFLAFLVAEYIEEGKMHLEDKASKYLSKHFLLPCYHEDEIKIFDLAIHTASLPMAPTTPMKLYQVSEIEIANYLRRYKLPRAPGKRYEESELGYAILAHLLTRLGKRSYEALLLEKVLQPLQMGETYYALPLFKTHLLAKGYKGIVEVGADFIDREWSFFKPVRGLISNIDNLRKWLSFLLKVDNSSSLACSLKHLYKSRYVFPDNTLKKRTLGFSLEPLSAKNSLPTYREEGVYQGFSHSMAFIPDTKTGVVILSNTDYGVESLATTILEMLNE